MKLYMHPVSTVCRPIRLLCAENGIKIDEETVDLMTGAHHKEAYASLNPNRQVPLLVDGDLKLTEGSAILKYIAEKYQLSSYPADLKKRAKINEVMDWLNTGFYRDFGYNLVYSQLFPHHKRRSDEAHAGTIAWGKDGSYRFQITLNTRRRHRRYPITVRQGWIRFKPIWDRYQRSGCSSSTTTGSARPTSICAETKSRSRTTSAPAWSRSVTSWAAI
jgi:glutathione S-transferase